jgi:hypothetical protein
MRRRRLPVSRRRRHGFHALRLIGALVFLKMLRGGQASARAARLRPSRLRPRDGTGERYQPEGPFELALVLRANLSRLRLQ